LIGMRHRFFHSAYFFAIMAVLLWSTVSTAFKLTLRHLTPLGLLFFSSLFAAVFLGVYSLKSTQGSGHKYFRRNLIASWKAGTLNPFIYYLMLFNAYDRLPAQQAQVLNYTWAIVLPLMTLAVMRETSIMQMTRVFSTFTPRLVAVSSPAPRALISQDLSKR